MGLALYRGVTESSHFHDLSVGLLSSLHMRLDKAYGSSATVEWSHSLVWEEELRELAPPRMKRGDRGREEKRYMLITSRR